MGKIVGEIKMTAGNRPEDNHEEQQGYARLLDVSAKLGLAVLVLCFCAYVFDLLPGKMALAQLAQHWHLPLDTYLAATGAPTGWRLARPLVGRGTGAQGCPWQQYSVR